MYMCIVYCVNGIQGDKWLKQATEFPQPTITCKQTSPTIIIQLSFSQTGSDLAVEVCVLNVYPFKSLQNKSPHS